MKKIVMRHASGKESSLTFKPDNNDVYHDSGQDLMWLDYEEDEMERIDVKECEARMDKAARDTAEREREIASLIDDAEHKILRDSDKWVPDNLVDDPMEVVARILFIATFKSNSPAYVGQWIIDMSKQIIERSVKAGLDS